MLDLESKNNEPYSTYIIVKQWSTRSTCFLGTLQGNNWLDGDRKSIKNMRNE